MSKSKCQSGNGAGFAPPASILTSSLEHIRLMSSLALVEGLPIRKAIPKPVKVSHMHMKQITGIISI
jgi:hypothetical protein